VNTKQQPKGILAMKILTITAAVLLTFFAGTGLVLADDDINPSTTATTVWVDGGGQDSMAKKTNKVHAEMNAKGWRFANLDVYTEDGDMKGIFVTYVRDPAPKP
jgi:hypothetical protein